MQRGVREMQAGGAIGAAAARRLIGLDPTFALPYLMLGLMQKEEGNLKEAESLLWQGIAQQPGMFPFYSELSHLIEQRDPSSKLSKALMQLALWNLTFTETVPKVVSVLFTDRLGKVGTM